MARPQQYLDRYVMNTLLAVSALWIILECWALR